MSVDFYGCESCGNSRYEEYVAACNKCYNDLCVSCLVDKNTIEVDSDFAYVYGYRFDSKNPELMERYKSEGFYLYNEDGTTDYEDGEIIGDSGIDSKYCPFCAGNKIDKVEVLGYLLGKCGLSLDEAWEEMKKSYQKEENE